MLAYPMTYHYTSVIIFYLQLLTDVEIIMETIIVFVDKSQAPISRWNAEHFQQMPFWTAKIVGLPVENKTLRGVIDIIIPAAYTLVAWLQQILMLVDHSQTEKPVDRDDKFG